MTALAETRSPVPSSERPFEGLSTFEQIYENYGRKRANGARIETAVIPIAGLGAGRAAYNTEAFVSDGHLYFFSRVEPEDGNSQDSDVRLVEYHTLSGQYFPNSVNIPHAQDPSVFRLNQEGQMGIGVVKIGIDPKKPGGISWFRPALYGLHGREIDIKQAALGMTGDKDVRPEYMGHNQSVTAKRFRDDSQGVVTSFLMLGLNQAPEKVDGQLSRAIHRTHTNPHSRIDVLQPHNLIWYGPETQVPLVSSKKDEIAAGLMFHIGFYTGKVASNKRPEREYLTAITEYTMDRRSGEVTSLTQPEIIATRDDFPQELTPKWPDVERVVILKSLIIDTQRGKITTYAVGGRGDHDSVIAKFEGNIFSRSIDFDLNKHRVFRGTFPQFNWKKTA